MSWHHVGVVQGRERWGDPVAEKWWLLNKELFAAGRNSSDRPSSSQRHEIDQAGGPQPEVPGNATRGPLFDTTPAVSGVADMESGGAWEESPSPRRSPSRRHAAAVDDPR